MQRGRLSPGGNELSTFRPAWPSSGQKPCMWCFLVFPKLPCIENIYGNKKAYVYCSAARNEKRFSFFGANSRQKLVKCAFSVFRFAPSKIYYVSVKQLASCCAWLGFHLPPYSAQTCPDLFVVCPHFVFQKTFIHWMKLICASGQTLTTALVEPQTEKQVWSFLGESGHRRPHPLQKALPINVGPQADLSVVYLCSWSHNYTRFQEYLRMLIQRLIFT